MALKQFQKIQNNDLKQKASKIQALFRGVKFRSKELPNIIENKLKEDKLIEVENKKRQKEAFLKYSALYQPKDDLTLKRVIKPTEPKLSVENDIKDRQKNTFLKYTELYKPQYNLRYRPF